MAQDVGESMSRYHIVRRIEHCHVCKKLTGCIVRINDLDPARTKKTSLCAGPNGCAVKVWA